MKSFVYKDQPVHYRKEGSGDITLVLLHGFPEDGGIFDIQRDYLGNYCQLIIPDLPGAGLSPYNEALRSVEDFAGMVAALLSLERVEKAIVLGHSMGGYITLALADLYPQLLKGFGFIHSSGFADSEEKKENRRKSIALMENYGSAAFVRKALPGNFSEKFRTENEALITRLTDHAAMFSTKGLQRFYQIMIDRPDRTAVLRTRKPLFFLIGDLDKAAPMDDVLRQVTLPDTAFVHILPGVAHMGMLEAAEKTNRYIKEFISYCGKA